MSTLHVVPVGDLLEHESTDDCACGPTPLFVDGGCVARHHSLDGREALERPDPMELLSLGRDPE